MDNSQVIDKAEGALIGSALGDAIGIYTGQQFNKCLSVIWLGKLTIWLEFMSPEQCREAYPSAIFSLVEPVTEPHQDTHRCALLTIILEMS